MTLPGFWWALLGGAAVTYAARAVFLVPDGTRPPSRLEPALKLVGPAVLAAIAVPAVLRAPGAAGLDVARLVAGLVAFGVALRTKSVLGTIAAGFAAVLLAGWVFSGGG